MVADFGTWFFVNEDRILLEECFWVIAVARKRLFICIKNVVVPASFEWTPQYVASVGAHIVKQEGSHTDPLLCPTLTAPPPSHPLSNPVTDSKPLDNTNPVSFHSKTDCSTRCWALPVSVEAEQKMSHLEKVAVCWNLIRKGVRLKRTPLVTLPSTKGGRRVDMPLSSFFSSFTLSLVQLLRRRDWVGDAFYANFLTRFLCCLRFPLKI